MSVCKVGNTAPQFSARGLVKLHSVDVRPSEREHQQAPAPTQRSPVWLKTLDSPATFNIMRTRRAKSHLVKSSV